MKDHRQQPSDHAQTSGGSETVACLPKSTGSGTSVQRQIFGRRGGFSLIELVIVIAVAVLLVGLLFPALAELRENAHRVVCGSNQRQIGMGIFMYDRDYGSLPYTAQLDQNRWEPRELMVAHLGGGMHNWDGIGLLFQWGYCRNANCFYCPSHTGEHRVDQYYDKWYNPDGNPIYTNFHYSGDVDWVSGQPRDLSLAIRDGNRLVLATDNLRSMESLNHRDGLNMLYGDGSVHWQSSLNVIEDVLPRSEEDTLQDDGQNDYEGLWRLIEQGLEGAGDVGK